MTSGMNKRDFSKEAPTYDTPPRIQLAEGVFQAIQRQVPLSKDMDVLDFGCGTGLLSMHFAPLVGSLTGVDSSEGMLAMFADKARAAGFDHVRGVHLDLTEGHLLPEGGYDLIISSMTLHHIQDIQGVLGQFPQALRPGGRVALADLDKEDGSFHGDNVGVFHFGFHRKEFAKLMQDQGFYDVQVMTATTMTKPGSDGEEWVFPILLVTAKHG